MSIFGKIMSAIFGSKAGAAAAGGGAATSIGSSSAPVHRGSQSMSRQSWTRRLPPKRKSWSGAPRSSI